MHDAERGERGPKGDHGQHGEEGPTGRTGAVPDMRAVVISLVLFVVAAVGVATWQVSNLVGENQRADYERCLGEAESAVRLNRQAEAFIEIEQSNPFQTTSPEAEDTVERRIMIYQDAILDVPDCERLKP